MYHLVKFEYPDQLAEFLAAQGDTITDLVPFGHGTRIFATYRDNVAIAVMGTSESLAFPRLRVVDPDGETHAFIEPAVTATPVSEPDESEQTTPNSEPAPAQGDDPAGADASSGNAGSNPGSGADSVPAGTTPITPRTPPSETPGPTAGDSTPATPVSDPSSQPASNSGDTKQ